MLNRVKLHFLALSVFGESSRHLATVLLSVLVIFILSSVLFISSSIKYTVTTALENEADMTVQRVRGGMLAQVPLSWEKDIVNIRGIDSVSPRVWGRYFTKPKGKSFLIIGVDFLDSNANKALSKIVGSTDLKKFLNAHNMLVSAKVKSWMKKRFYTDSYSFLSADGEFIKMNIYATLPKNSDLLSNDVIIMPIDDARKILGIKEGYVTDFVLNVPNDAQKVFIEDKLSSLHFDIRVVSKKESLAAYDESFNFRNGFFLTLFMILLATFSLILYQRYTQSYSTQKRQIGIYRALGWSIKDILTLKFYEIVVIILGSYVTGVGLAYIFVYIANAPVLRDIFLGSGNFSPDVVLIPVIDFSALSSIFLLYAIPFVASVLIPVWKIAVSDPKEAML